MATRSPVVIESSSPETRRCPTATPQPSKKFTVALSSSSPDLPHPSAFFKSHTPGLFTGSKAQEVPQGISIGFASASSLWKAQKLETEAGVAKDGKGTGAKQASLLSGDQKEIGEKGRAASKSRKSVVVKGGSRRNSKADKLEGSGSSTPPSVTEIADSVKKSSKKATGKLKSASKASTSALQDAEFRTRSSLAEFALPAQPSPTRTLADNSLPTAKAIIKTPAPGKIRKASVSLSEYDFKPDSPSSRGTATPLRSRAGTSTAVKLKASRSAATPNPAYKPARKITVKPAKRKTTGSDTASQSNSRRSSICLSEYQLETGNVARSGVTEHAQCQVLKLQGASSNEQQVEFGVGHIDLQGLEQAGASSKSPERATEVSDLQSVVPRIIEADLEFSAKERPVEAASLAELPAPAAKTSRKRASKKFTKSASIILNSDEPESHNHGDAGLQVDTSLPALPKSKKSVRKPRVKKVQTPARTESVEDDKPNGFDAHNNAFSQSAYFANNDAASCQALPPATTEESMQSVLVFEGITREPTPPPVPRPFRRRRSWTPARNTETTHVTPGGVASVASAESPAPGPSLAALVSGFNYNVQGSGASHDRSSTGEAALKKRRIELAPESAIAGAPRKPPEAAAPAKRVKGVKKKPMTITDQATKAYRNEPVADPLAEQPTVSDYFAPQKETVEDCENEIGGANTTDKPVKARKSRKRRIKIGGDPEAVAAAVAKQAQKKVKKVKIREPDLAPPLFSPARARAVEKQQGFLFGTSSQLEVDDSPSFILQMQAAIRESEATAASQEDFSPRRKSCAAVPTAPHGTSLSVGQAERALWCTASRDHCGDVLATVKRRRTSSCLVRPAGPEALESTLDLDQNQHAAPCPITEDLPHGRAADLKSPAGTLTNVQSNEQAVVNLCDTSPPTRDAGYQFAIPALDNLPQLRNAGSSFDNPAAEDLPQLSRNECADRRPDEAAQFEDTWMLLSSDGPKQEETDRASNSLSRAPTLRALPALPRSATSPTRMRAALQALAVNTSVFATTSPPKFIQQRAFASATSPPAKRGRPRKDPAAVENIPPQSKRRGRPPKSATTTTMTGPSICRPALSASQGSSSSDFVNIDEIYDSDPPTPSPPRRRAASTPPSVRPLQLTPAGEPASNIAGPAILTSMLKNSDPQWTSVSAALFPQITKVVKATPPSTDLANPTWHEKILLYDPIVLEDLTAWLNGQGVRVETRKVKAKAKKKGKKKLDVEVAMETVVEDVEYELVREELKPWMVQKWCEEKSICCLWREGLRGGVKVRY